MSDILGPNPNLCTITSDTLNIFISECHDYISTLSLFKKYCLFRYTIGSGPLNTYLITGTAVKQSRIWALQFFQYWYNTTPNPQQGIPAPYKQFLPYLTNPPYFKSLTQQRRHDISANLLLLYANTLQEIILNGPKVKGEGFDVYKIATPYDDLPNSVKYVPVNVEQYLFNSTSVSKLFNFVLFSNPEHDCCLFKIHVPAGSQCLYISPYLAAYPWEEELLLPLGVIFKINKISTGTLNYITPSDMNIIQVQEKNNIRMGNVYLINRFQPCKSGVCKIKSKNFIIYSATLVNGNYYK